MSDTPSTTVDVSDSKNDRRLKRPSRDYGYLGEDGEGFHHHVDEATNTIYVTTSHAERFYPENANTQWFRISGNVDHVEDLEQYDDRGLTEWIAYVDSVRGWHDRPFEISSVLTDAFSQRGGRQ
ncbi:hypothetical protein CV102_18185 [Natronococcus pandeyae]|uniref:Uncharacterized protein n=1 Tax=Natronococcus pandeyae TaxID=2055836 RepID=A0A8J8Q2E1_9EURY|nr:hypothetical protein [Natronococcus pandeyae]TYL37243.1 hypothetical protein CV102_18185 [Natronococcus pandeyae]